MIISQLIKDGYMHGVDIPQLETFEAGMLFARTEGGLIDMPSYEAYIKGDLQNYTVTDEMIAENLAELDKQQ